MMFACPCDQVTGTEASHENRYGCCGGDGGVVEISPAGVTEGSKEQEVRRAFNWAGRPAYGVVLMSSLISPLLV